MSSCRPNIAPPLGPVIGGALSSTLGWESIFWFLAIFGGSVLLLILFTLPETARRLVGNGSIPAHGSNKTLWSVIVKRKHDQPEPEEQSKRPKLSLPNPLASLKLLLLPDVGMVLFANGIYYTIYCCVQASLSSIFMDTYGYSELQAGLIYLPFGAACLASLLTWGELLPTYSACSGVLWEDDCSANTIKGKLLDYDYAKLARAGKDTLDCSTRHSQDDFPIEKARLGSALCLVMSTTVAAIGYGWAIQYRIVRSDFSIHRVDLISRLLADMLHNLQHVSVPLILQAILGFSITGLFSVGEPRCLHHSRPRSQEKELSGF